MRARPFLREGFRFYKRNRVLVLCGISILAIGMSVSAVSLSVLWVISHSSVPGARPGSYATIGENSPGAPLQPMSWRTLKRVQEDLPEVTVGAYGSLGEVTATYDGNTRNVHLASASANLFEKFAEPLAAGHGFSGSDEELGAGPVPLILSFRLAQELFGSPSAALGNSIRVNGVVASIVGVASPSFAGLFHPSVDAWVPPRSAVIGISSQAMFSDAWQNATAFYGLVAMPSGGNEQAAATVKRALRGTPRALTLAAVPGFNTDPARMVLMKAWAGLAMFAAMLLALASGFTLGGLLLAPAHRLFDEVRLKRTLGAASLRLAFELVAGPIWVVLCGFLGAGGFALIAVEVLQRRLESLLPSLTLSLSGVFLALLTQLPITLGMTVGVALIPALRLLRDSGIPRLSETGRTTRSGRFLEAIVVVQVVCCVCACVTAAMVARSALRLEGQPLGYQPENRIVLVLGTTKAGGISYMTDFRGGTTLQAAFHRVSGRISELPGVKGVAVAQAAPLDPSSQSILLSELGADSDRPHTVSYNGITPNYFKVLGTPLIAGRELSGGLLSGDPTEAIINETLRKQIWPNTNPLGKILHLQHPFGTTFTVTVVGVTADQRIGGPKESVLPTIFLPLGGNVFQNLPEHVIVSGSLSGLPLQAAANEELSSALPGLEVVRHYEVEDRVHGVLVEEQRRVLPIMTAAAGIAVIAYIGLYSLLIYFISGKRRELAVRVCCGATPLVIFKIVVTKAIRIGVAADLIAIVCWVALRYIAASGWIGATSWSTPVAAAVSLLCFSAVVATAVFPAFRACRLEPAQGLLATQ